MKVPTSLITFFQKQKIQTPFNFKVAAILFFAFQVLLIQAYSFTPPSPLASLFQNNNPKEAYDNNDFQTATQLLTEKNKNISSTDHYNIGCSQYKTQDYASAAESFKKVLQTPLPPTTPHSLESVGEPSLQQKALYNLANTEYRLGENSLSTDPEQTIQSWEQAVSHYQSAIELDPNDLQAKENLDFVKEKLEKLKEEQNQQQDQSQENQQDNQEQNQEQDQQQDQNNSQDQNQNKDQNQNQDKDQQDQQQNQQQDSQRDQTQKNNDSQDSKGNQQQNSQGNKSGNNNGGQEGQQQEQQNKKDQENKDQTQGNQPSQDKKQGENQDKNPQANGNQSSYAKALEDRSEDKRAASGGIPPPGSPKNSTGSAKAIPSGKSPHQQESQISKAETVNILKTLEDSEKKFPLMLPNGDARELDDDSPLKDW